jgi:uncharacterized membrane protein
MKLDVKIKRWMNEDIISAEQMEAILSFEQSMSKKTRSQISLYAFVILGCCVLSIGLVSVIAANWNAIPEAMKLIVAFLGLGGIGFGAYRANSKNRVLMFEGLSTLFMLACLATIGLIAQVFHTGGAPYQALALWLVIVLPLALLAKRKFLPNLWIVGLITTFFVWVLDRNSWWAVNFMTDRYFDLDNLLPVFIVTALLSVPLASIFGRFTQNRYFTKSLWSWGFVAGIVAMFVGDGHYTEFERVGSCALYPALSLLPLASLLVINRKDVHWIEKVAVVSFLCFSVGIFIPSLFMHDWKWKAVYDLRDAFQIIGAAYFIISALLLALVFAIRKRFWLFRTMIILVGLRFLVVYFQVFEDLATTGLGLLVSGGVILGMTFLGYKLSPKLNSWVQEVSK